MGQSLVRCYIHIVFSTKYRQPFIDDDIEKELFAYLATLINDYQCQTVITGGYRDHVHILCNLGKDISIARLLARVKQASSAWVKTKGEKYQNFYWQTGYAAFSVNAAHMDQLIAYIRNQRAHHQKKDFTEELLSILHHYKIPYDEKYLWD